MSAELYDAEVAAALAHPAIDVLPTYGRRGRPAETAEPTAPQDAETAEPTTLDDSPAPRTFLGLHLRRPKAERDAAAESPADEPSHADLESWPAPTAWVPEVEPAAEAAVETIAVPAVEPIVEPVVLHAVEPVAEALAAPVQQPAPVDLSDEVRALRSLLEASEAQRIAAENASASATAYAQQAQTIVDQAQAQAKARVEQAEARARSAANDAQDWQIRHREAESTVAQLAASLANAEQRLGDLRDQLDWVSAERDELMQALEEATSPDRASSGS